MGATDPVFDVLTTLAFWLEMVRFRWNLNALLLPYAHSFIDDIAVPEGGVKSNAMASASFSRIFNLDEFAAGGAVSKDLGSHSIRKFAVTHSRRSGCSKKDERNLHGWWKYKRHVADVYEDAELPYRPDTKVAKILCIGGACYYLFPEELNTTTNTAGDNVAAAGGVVSMMAMMKNSGRS